MSVLECLQRFQASKTDKLKLAATQELNASRERGLAWIEENAVVSRRDEVGRKDNGERRQLDCHMVRFQGKDFDPRFLIYLQLLRTTSLVFIDTPQLKDYHLRCLQNQPNLISLTLENTGVQGYGFRFAKLPKVGVVWLTGSPIQGSSLRLLSKERFSQLKELHLENTEVSDKSLKRFSPAGVNVFK